MLLVLLTGVPLNDGGFTSNICKSGEGVGRLGLIGCTGGCSGRPIGRIGTVCCTGLQCETGTTAWVTGGRLVTSDVGLTGDFSTSFTLEDSDFSGEESDFSSFSCFPEVSSTLTTDAVGFSVCCLGLREPLGRLTRSSLHAAKIA